MADKEDSTDNGNSTVLINSPTTTKGHSLKKYEDKNKFRSNSISIIYNYRRWDEFFFI